MRAIINISNPRLNLSVSSALLIALKMRFLYFLLDELVFMPFVFLQVDQKLIVHFPAAATEFNVSLAFLGESVNGEMTFRQ